MGQTQWAIWANEQAILSCLATLIGGIVGVAGMLHNWQFATATIPISLLLMMLEYPRGKRRKGTTVERRYQRYIEPVFAKMGPVTKNYYVRAVFHLLLSIPCCFLLPTLMGGMCLIIASFIYLVAAVKGEEWEAVSSNTSQQDMSSLSTLDMVHQESSHPRKDATVIGNPSLGIRV